MIPSAALIAVGSELLSPVRQDTNSLWLTERLERRGIPVMRKVAVGDDRRDIADALSEALGRANLVVATGGLGPTADDCTREAVAERLGRSVRRDEAILEAIRGRYRRRGLAMPVVNEKQADVIEGSVVLPNPHGTAPGLWIEEAGRVIVLLPGVPHEMKAMWEGEVEPRLGASTSRDAVWRRVLKVAAVPESRVEELVQSVYLRWPCNPVTILATFGEVQLHLAAHGAPAEANACLDAQEADFRDALRGGLFGRDDETLEEVVGGLLREFGRTLAVAESCTGGLIVKRLTDVPGSSDYLRGGIVAYSNAVKEQLLDVPREALARHGAVSAEVAAAMANGVRNRMETDFGLAVTGVAGPGGGSEEKPVGTVCLGLSERGREAMSLRRRLAGNRDGIRRWAAALALEVLRRRLLGLPEER